MEFDTRQFDNTPRAAWFPGHMLKAEQAMRKALSLVDLVIELVDARAPLSTRNPKLIEWLNRRPHIVLANKADLANAEQSRRWKSWFEARGEDVYFLEASHLHDPSKLTASWKELLTRERAARGATRPLLRPFRVMIVGIPNIGKSTLVNRLREKRIAKVGPKAGVTRSNQWVPLSGGLELLDTPGVLWPQLRDKRQELMLTLLGNIPDEPTEPALTAEFLIWRAAVLGIKQPWKALDLGESIPEEPVELLEALALRRKMLLPGGLPAIATAAQSLLKDFRSGKLGRWTLELPPEGEDA